MTEFILHHYPQSPMAEKARLALGHKGLSWHSVEIPRLPPRPDFSPLTGGYRRVPVMQIGADIYCDTKCILRELEARSPAPPLFPEANAGMASVIGSWADATLFNRAVHITIANMVDTMPKEWLSDRTQLMFGPDQRAEDLQNDLPFLTTQVATEIGWIDQQLGNNPFLFGDAPSVADISVYPIIWVLRARWEKAEEAFSQCQALAAWESRMADIGHGTPQDMTSQDALDIAQTNEPQTPKGAEPGDPQGLEPGMAVAIGPDGPGNEAPVRGTIRYLSSEKIALDHVDERVGAMAINFPRLGYVVTPE